MQLREEDMRARQPYTIYKRSLKSGKKVYYYQTYDQKGKRTNPRSTGQTTKAAALHYIQNLIKNDLLIPNKRIRLSEFIKDWWIWERCPYVRRQIARGKVIGRRYVDQQYKLLKKHILPYFGERYLDSIESIEIEKWMFHLRDSIGLSSKTVNYCFTNLGLIFKEAKRSGIVTFYPLEKVQRLAHTPEKRGILQDREILKLFSNIALYTIWQRNYRHLVLNQLAALTGLRMGELQALNINDVHPGYIHVEFSWDRKYGLKSTKTDESRDIPICNNLYNKLIEVSPKEGFVFSSDNGQTPVHNRTITKVFYRALENIGISNDARKKRGLVFHSWRHYFNSVGRSYMSDGKLRMLTGHNTPEMTEKYSHQRKEDFPEIIEMQKRILKLTG